MRPRQKCFTLYGCMYIKPFFAELAVSLISLRFRCTHRSDVPVFHLGCSSVHGISVFPLHPAPRIVTRIITFIKCHYICLKFYHILQNRLVIWFYLYLPHKIAAAWLHDFPQYMHWQCMSSQLS